ncbi:MAG TPA: DUF4339 domain-containing protein [Chthoniobacteraceae bacterium]|jgi:TM2 domain-containing membrane protein YozV|nr:DUF4339 domain-containing protein [Chthoniobacteraceae bacterium]
MSSPIFNGTDFGNYLLELDRDFAREMTLSDAARTLAPAQWYEILDGRQRAARIIADCSTGDERVITVAFPSGPTSFRLVWDATRAGWVAGELIGSRVTHYFAPSSGRGAALTSLCKRGFAGIDVVMTVPKSLDPKLCKTCLKRIQETRATAAGESTPTRPMTYFLFAGDQVQGPFGAPDIMQMILQGEVDGSAKVCREGDDDWRPVDEIVTVAAPPPLPVATLAVALPPPLPISSCSRGAYVMLGIFLGLLGLHNFYAGRFREGAIQMVLTVVFCWTLIVPLCVAVWVFVDLIANTVDGKGRRFRSANTAPLR